MDESKWMAMLKVLKDENLYNSEHMCVQALLFPEVNNFDCYQIR